MNINEIKQINKLYYPLYNISSKALYEANKYYSIEIFNIAQISLLRRPKTSIDTIDWQIQRTFEMKFCEIKLTRVAKKKKRKTLHENIANLFICRVSQIFRPNGVTIFYRPR